MLLLFSLSYSVSSSRPDVGTMNGYDHFILGKLHFCTLFILAPNFFHHYSGTLRYYYCILSITYDILILIGQRELLHISITSAVFLFDTFFLATNSKFSFQMSLPRAWGRLDLAQANDIDGV
jgi:hypothetical protein